MVLLGKKKIYRYVPILEIIEEAFLLFKAHNVVVVIIIVVVFVVIIIFYSTLIIIIV